jgi:hypothetical protein
MSQAVIVTLGAMYWKSNGVEFSKSRISATTLSFPFWKQAKKLFVIKSGYTRGW